MNVSTFVIWSALAIGLTILFALWPNLRAKVFRDRSAAVLPTPLVISFVMLIPLVTVAFYLLVGTYGAAEVTDPRITLLRSKMIEMAKDLERNPDQPEVWQRMGLVYKDLQHYGPAEHTLRRALYLRPGSAFLHVELAETLQLRSELPAMPPEGRELLKRAVSLEPDNLKALWLLATDDFRAESFETAIAWWEQMLPLVPEDSQIYRAAKSEAERARAMIDRRP